jgi:hypothetical protein
MMTPVGRRGVLWGSGFAALAAALVVSGVASSPAHAATAARCKPTPAKPAYGLELEALSNRKVAQLVVTVIRLQAACPLPGALVSVLVQASSAKGQSLRRWQRQGVPAVRGRARLGLKGLSGGERLNVTVRPGPGQPLVRRTTTVRIRPDLTVARVNAPENVVAGVPFTLAVFVGEQAGDIGTRAAVTVSDGDAVLGSRGPAQVRAGKTAKIPVTVTVPAGGAQQLTVSVADATRREANIADNRTPVSLDAFDFQIAASQALVPSFAGYGMQFNQHEYADISAQAGVNETNVKELEQKVVALQPQFVRIFFNPSEFRKPDQMASFIRTAQLAERAGATINVTWTGGWADQPVTSMGRFADVLADLVNNRGVTNLKWVTAQNEPNSGLLTQGLYLNIYRALDQALRARGIRGKVGIMGGDLVGTVSPLGQTQADWFRFMATRMASLVDAYSIHVYWDYWNAPKLVRRLTEVRRIVDALPAGGRRPVYVTEFGVRGLRTVNGTRYPQPGLYADGTPLEQTTINAFQHAWFDVLAARLGYYGVVKWDGYFGKYDSGTQDYSLIGPPQQGWPQRPIYYLTRLFTQATRAGWRVVGANGAPAGKLVSAYAGPNGQLTVIGLDTDGAPLNAASATQVSYRIEGLPPNTAFQLELWNGDGSGRLAAAPSVRSDGLGVGTVTAPLQSVFALTTVR